MRYAGPEPAFEQAPRWFGAEIGLAAGPRVIAVDVRDEGAFGRTPGIHVEAAAGAEEARGAVNQHRPDTPQLPSPAATAVADRSSPTARAGP